MSERSRANRLRKDLRDRKPRASDIEVLRCAECGDELPEGGWFDISGVHGPFCDGCSKGLENRNYVGWVK